jgi:hypothetical protein
MPQQRLDRADIVAALKKVRSEAMTERMATGVLGDTCTSNGVAHGFLDHGGVKVMPASLTRGVVDVGPGRWKDPLIVPRRSGSGVLARKSVR